MNISLEGKIAVICGSTQGIGWAIAKEFAAAGAVCILVARDEKALRGAVEQLPVSHGQHHDFRVADFSKTDQVKEAAISIASAGAVHILVNNTGGPSGGPIIEAEEEAFINAFNQHIVCNQILAKAFVPGMKQLEYGRIINIISTSVKIPINNLGVSNTIRGAVASWSKTMANELGIFGITVNNILPGFTETQRLEWLLDSNARKAGKPVAEIRAAMMNDIPLKRFARPEETAALAAFLASPAASYISGTNIPVDGGRTGSM